VLADNSSAARKRTATSAYRCFVGNCQANHCLPYCVLVVLQPKHKYARGFICRWDDESRPAWLKRESLSIRPLLKPLFQVPKCLGQYEKINMKDAHNQAAEHHESAAKSHRAAAEAHGKNEHAKGKEHATQAQQHAQNASEHSKTANTKSAQQK
jgi:hypothetical protein